MMDKNFNQPKSPSPQDFEQEWNALGLEEQKAYAQGLKEELTRKEEEWKREKRELEKAFWELRVDPRTGLERDLLYYRGLNESIAHFINRGHLKEITSKESLDQNDIAELDQLHLSVTHADIGYLSKYNEDPLIGAYYGEHAGGDEILKQSGAVIQEADLAKRAILPQLREEVKGYRIGGDEFALVQALSKEEAQRVALEFSRKHSSIEIKGADLQPAVNCGTASLREAVEAMMQAFPLRERAHMSPEDQAKELQKFLTHIADRRARVAKGLDRLLTMAWLKRDRPEQFQRNYQWLQKGAFGMKEEEFEEMTRLLDSPAELNDAIKAVVREKLETQVHREEDQRILERKIVVAIADRDLLNGSSV